MSEIQDNDLYKEQERVDFIVNEIKAKAQKLSKGAKHIGSDVLEIRKTFWEDVTVNFDEPDDIAETYTSIKQQAALLAERERSFKQTDKQLRLLARLKNSPYFGRIDFHELGESETEKVYLGIASLMDREDENFLIYDWRAPISSLYYDHAPGPAGYSTPEGRIEGDMKLKRQFVIRDSKIKAMFETGVTIGDELLREVLGNNANTQMKTIVATIQKEQNQIIRNEKSKLLIVQGVAGSGKTSAALQRVAYLLYRYRGTITSENILLFSPNPLFNSYVGTVLPELGEENMQQTTFQEYIISRIGREFEVEDPFSQLEFLLSSADVSEKSPRIQGIRFKSTLEYKEAIDEYASILSKKGLLFRDLLFRNEGLISKEEIGKYFYSLDKNFSMPNRIQLVKEWLLKEMRRKVKKEQSKSWVEEELQFLDKEDFLEAFKKLQEKKRFNENSFDDFELEQKWLSEMVVKEKFKPIFNAIKKLKFVDMPGIYSQFFQSVSKKAGFPDKWAEICSGTLNRLESSQMAYEDATPFVYLQDLIEGRKSNPSIRHIFIDEAQDYSPFQFAFLQSMFPYSKMTLLGDFNQAIFSGASGADTVLTSQHDLNDDILEIKLNRTYRSTRPIVDFTRYIIEGGDKIEPFNREGKRPEVILTNEWQINSEIAKKIKEMQDNGNETIAVICLTASESKKFYEKTKDLFPSHLIEKGTMAYEKGISVIPAYLAKGIEFDAVILYDISKYSRESERKLFYTACTRAMHELHLFSKGGISPLMDQVPKEFYQLSK